MGLLFRGKVAPFLAVRIWFIYREIEGGSRRGDLNQYWSLVRPVLVTARSSIGIYCQPVLVGRVTSTGSFFYLYRLLRTVGEEGYSVSVGVAIFARADMAGGSTRVLCFVPILVRSYGLSGVLPAEGCTSLIDRVL